MKILIFLFLFVHLFFEPLNLVFQVIDVILAPSLLIGHSAFEFLRQGFVVIELSLHGLNLIAFLSDLVAVLFHDRLLLQVEGFGHWAAQSLLLLVPGSVLHGFQFLGEFLDLPKREGQLLIE